MSLEELTTREVVVPNMVDDFEEDDRVWFIHPKKKVKMLATVMKDPVKRFLVNTDDGVILSVTADPADKDSPIKVYMLSKVLDLNSLTPDMRLSKKVASKDGFVIRFPAVVERVRPGREVVLHHPDPSRNNYRQVFTHSSIGDTLEYQLAGWEIEE